MCHLSKALGLFFVLSLSSCKKANEPTKKIIPPATSWFTVSTIDDDTKILEEKESSQANVLYLISGSERSILFDSGSGENRAENGFKIKPHVEALVDSPISLVLSHFHFDHSQNVNEFENIIFPDIPFLRKAIDENQNYTFSKTDLFEGSSPKQIKVSEWLPISKDIDLGGRTIQLMHIPGHTDESVAMVDKERKLIFLGDFFYNGTLFTFKEGDIEKYVTSVAKITALIDEEYRLFGAHDLPEISLSNFNKLSRLLNCIKNKNCQGTAQMAFGRPILLYNLDGLQIAAFQ